jgi:hypothetical protein
LRIFFEPKVVTAIEDFTTLVRSGAVKSRAIGGTAPESFRYPTPLQGLKPTFIISNLRHG